MIDSCLIGKRMGYSIRDFREKDARAIVDLRLLAIQQLGSIAYSHEQVAAWSARMAPADDLIQRVAEGDFIVVAVNEQDEPVAYALLQPDGHLDHLYVHPAHTRMGLADRLLAQCEKLAMDHNAKRLHTEASALARPAFERAGYVVTHRRDFEIAHDGKSVAIHNYAMEKPLR